MTTGGKAPEGWVTRAEYEARMTPTTTLTLAAFLEARLDEDEAAARAALQRPWTDDTFGHVTAEVEGYGTAVVCDAMRCSDAAHIARHDPARVLAQVAAMRAVVELHGAVDWVYEGDDGKVDAGRGCASCLTYRGGFRDYWEPDRYPCPTLRALAQVWASDPAFDPAWSA